jgi:tetratricopeptide (TPR) repeat protein
MPADVPHKPDATLSPVPLTKRARLTPLQTNVRGLIRALLHRATRHSNHASFQLANVISDSQIQKLINIGQAGVVQIRLDAALGSSVPHQLRAPAADFTGRGLEVKQLTQILFRAAAGESPAAVIGLFGMGGVGKTELANVVAHRVGTDFPGGQLLVELHGTGNQPLSPSQAMRSVVQAFDSVARLPDDPDELERIYRATLAGKRVLILADDALNASQVRPLMPPEGCALLITSRQRFLLPGMVALEVGLLPQDEAVIMTQAICPRIGGAASCLASLCGYLPLALRISASLLASDDSLGVAPYLELLADENKKLVALRDPDDPERNVESSLWLSYDALGSTLQSVLSQASVFSAGFDLDAARAVIAAEGQVEALLSTLRRRSLLEWDCTIGRYSLHDLVRVFAAARLREADAVRLRHARHYLQVAENADDLYLQGGEAAKCGLSLFDLEWKNIQAGQSWAASVGADSSTAEVCSEYPNAVQYCLRLRRQADERIRWLKAALQAARKLGKPEFEGTHLGNLGSTYMEQGDDQRAVMCYQQALAVLRRTPDRLGESRVLANLGNAYAITGQQLLAIECYTQAWRISRDLATPEHSETQRTNARRSEGGILIGLGSAYEELGDFRRALEFYEQALAAARELHDLRMEGAVLLSLGNNCLDLGEPQQAARYYEQAATLARQCEDTRLEGKALWNASLALERLGQRALMIANACEALRLLEQAQDPLAAAIREHLGSAASTSNYQPSTV